MGTVGAHSNYSRRVPLPLSELQKLAALAVSVGPSITADPPKPWSVRRRLTTEVRAEIVARYQAGIGTPELCCEYELSKYSVLKLLREEGVQMRRQPLTPSQRQNAVRLYEDGETIDAVAEKLNASYGRVREALLEAGVVLHPPGRRRVS